ncbi:complex I NDUFA9 subunit family protein [Croceicoccus sp. YJ47]|uniref:complex I NDUFA9 subunit family protein n=1 Tax=Croceicoccus sp. YJ47 TaxID=2798724 RepID=UPI001922D728|nr:complex I NDUFA9 subunit family protein [Croceicoccus sp. YJ47]QQN73330.1 complex I NDUFA9 subunit family protein [Croceicoccus sp. YJ47]
MASSNFADTRYAGTKDPARLSGKLVTLIGGSGFFGTHVAQDLLSTGARLRIASRNPERSHSLKPLANLGQIQFARCNITHADSVRAAVSGADAVVNLVGAFEGDLNAIQGEGAGRVAHIAREAGVMAFVHVSAIGADEHSQIPYQHSKGVGERTVLEAFPDVTILRPSILFGGEDEFLNMFGGLISKFPALPVFAPEAEMQPLYVDDAAAAVLAALQDSDAHGGKIYEIAGPERLSMLEINRRIAQAQGRDPTFLPLPDAVGRMMAKVMGALPGGPINADQYAMLAQGNVASGTKPGLDALGVTPRPMTLYLDRWMTRFRKHGRFTETRA